MTAAKPTTAEAQLDSLPGGDGLGWLGDLAISILVAVPYGWFLLGPIIWPGNVAWLKGDAAQHYIGWAMFRMSSGWHWPLTYTTALGYPIGESVALVDLTPIVALLMRPFSSVLPANFQYLGLYSVLCLILQFFFGVRLLRSVLPGRQWVSWLGGLFFLIAPPLTFRFVGHYSLASHWVILAALLLYSRMVSAAYSVSGTIWRVAGLTVVAVGVNPYIAAMAVSVLVAACFTTVMKRYMTLPEGVAVLAMIGVCFAVSASALGLIGSTGADFTAEGYRNFSMNSLAPIDPSVVLPALDPLPVGSPILPSQRTFASGQYEGYNYLGAGILLLLILAVLVTVTGRIRLQRSDLVTWAPLAVCGAIFAVLALSTLVSMGDHVVLDWDPNQRLTPYFAAFRASGRLFWLPYYLITTYAVVTVVRFSNPQVGIALVAGALALQMYDTNPIRQYTKRILSGFTLPRNLASPVWRTLNLEHRNLIILPAWQCRGDTPGDGDGFRIFGLLAAEQGLTINSYFAAPYHQPTLPYHCKTAIEQVSKEGLAAHTAYVVSPEIGRAIAKSKSGDDHCYSVDGFLLCTMAELAGVAHWRVPTVLLGNGSLTAQDGGYFVSGWEPAVAPGFGLWSVSPKAVLAYHTAIKPAKSLRLTLMVPAGRNPVPFTVIHEGGEMEGVVPVTDPPRVEMFTVRLPIGGGSAVHEVTIVNRQLRTPPEQGFKNSDTRRLGIGVHSLAADACPPSSSIDFHPTDIPDPACVIR